MSNPPPPPSSSSTPLPRPPELQHDNRPYGSYAPTPDECTMAMLVQLLTLANGIGLLAALIVWLMRKDHSRFVDFHGKQAMFLELTVLGLGVVIVMTLFVGVGICLVPILIPGLIITTIILKILAGMAAYHGQWYRYPIIGDWVK